MPHPAFPLTAALGHDLVVLGEVGSTNQYLVDNPGETDRVKIVVTTHQSAGRGRRGRQWVTPPGAGVALSVGLPAGVFGPTLQTVDIQLVSLLSGVCVAMTVSRHVDAAVEVKWPNDVLVAGKKVAGILGEITPDQRVIIGVGVNLGIPHDHLPTADATSLHLHGAKLDGLADRFVADCVRELLERLPVVSTGLTTQSRSWVESWLGTLGRAVTVELPSGEEVSGVAEALGDDGSLVVQDRRGTRFTVTSGDVHHLRHSQDAT